MITSRFSGGHAGSRLLRVAVVGAALAVVTGCAQFSQQSAAPTTQPAVTQAPADSQSAVEGGTTAPSTESGTGTQSGGASSDLRYVSTTASPCSSVWTSGAVLPLDYEWCLDETGNAVAGVRIGSCEIVAFRDQMYAVPGQTIVAGAGALQNDPQFVAALTSCKRRPAGSS